MTVEAWVRLDAESTPNTSSPGLQYIVFKKNTRTIDYGNFEGYTLVKNQVSGQDVFGFTIASASGQQVNVNSTTVPQVGVWYHVAGTYDAGSGYLSIYLNGVLEDSAYAGFPMDYDTTPIFIGTTGQNWDGKLQGSVDEVSIYNRALSANEIGVVYNAGSAGKCLPMPVVSITSPTNTAFFDIGSNIGVMANAYEPGAGTIEKVEFFQGSIRFGTSTNSPYSVTWSNVIAGEYALSARATGNNGLISTSDKVNITVGGVIKITNPTNNLVLTSPADIAIGAEVIDDVEISQVEFFQGATNLGVVATAPYDLLWTNVASGIYALTARATDNNGLILTSSVVNVIVDTYPDSTDRDGDGVSDMQEYLNGTDPLDYYNGYLPEIRIVGGNVQQGLTNTWLSLPLSVQLTDTNTNLLVNAPVTFAVTPGSGLISDFSNGTTSTSIQLRTDTNGRAAVWLQLPSTNSANIVTASAQSGTNLVQVAFREIAKTLGEVSMMAIGGERIMALTGGGDVVSWGGNHYGELGDYTYLDSTNPVQVVWFTNIVKIASGLNHSLAIDSQGVLWAWGDNEFGELGH